jgi:hypothetical protein
MPCCFLELKCGVDHYVRTPGFLRSELDARSRTGCDSTRNQRRWSKVYIVWEQWNTIHDHDLLESLLPKLNNLEFDGSEGERLESLGITLFTKESCSGALL